MSTAKRISKVISSVLVFCMFFGMIPAGAYNLEDVRLSQMKA